MMRKFFLSLFVMSMVLAGCGSDDSSGAPPTDDTTDDNGGGPTPSATYRITFRPDFTADNFPEDYPDNPRFSEILVAVHATNSHIFQEGTQASDGIKALAETGDPAELVNELSAQGDDDTILFLVTVAPNDGGPTDEQAVTVTIDPEKTSISFITSLSPSPDWFVGVDAQSLVTGNTLVEELDINLVAFDAGTDSGMSYESPDEPTDPPGLITEIDTPPLGNDSGLSSIIGTLRIERTDI